MDMNALPIFVTFLVAFIVCWVLMPPFINIMEKYRILDKSGGRKIHSGYTAHLGGVVIALSFSVAIVSTLFTYRQEVALLRMLYFAILMLIMLFVGIRDDMNNLSPMAKLCFEIMVGFAMAYAGLKITDFTTFNNTVVHIPEFLSYALTIFFFIVVCNSYNLIDGIDGQAGMQAINTFLFIFLFFFIYAEDSSPFTMLTSDFMSMICVAIIGSLLGFLKFNWQKARVFMGDTGSLFIGTMITIVLIMATKYAFACTFIEDNGYIIRLKSTVVPFVCFFYLPLADTLRVFVGRVLKKKSPFSADKTHIHHILLHLGYSHQRITLTTFTISFLISVISVALAFVLNDVEFAIVLVLSWFVYVYVIYSVARKLLHKKL
ncbi:MAG: undecaprenyl/decaprenyl-phosphate alpha-N-acetylglucosaminyl 1-phosphate transferase [Bacteroidales bacterium]|nr:undecaprenyl/decaprenyl-phosphate alpha-N-acetylglucosaminyl 1-phosphate transferase [Bacteroidales bacterium]